jgi:opacity protein-like surface antigen
MISRSAWSFAGGIAAAAALAWPNVASAQAVIRQPGNHPRYSVEIEPHLAFQWASRFGADDGFGPGVRFNIPFMHNGPIKTINNNMGITFGMDLTFGDGGPGWCYGRYDRDRWLNGADCDVTEFWLPVAMQWNFWLTDVISVFGEPGFAIVHRRWSYEWYCSGVNGALCDTNYNDTDVEFVFGAGGRFMFSDNIGATVRIGFPMISAGINFLL